MCFFGSRPPPPAEPDVIVTQPPPAAPAKAPTAPAAPPIANEAKSGEVADQGANKTGFSALLIPRTAFGRASKNVAGG